MGWLDTSRSHWIVFETLVAKRKSSQFTALHLCFHGVGTLPVPTLKSRNLEEEKNLGSVCIYILSHFSLHHGQEGQQELVSKNEKMTIRMSYTRAWSKRSENLRWRNKDRGADRSGGSGKDGGVIGCY